MDGIVDARHGSHRTDPIELGHVAMDSIFRRLFRSCSRFRAQLLKSCLFCVALVHRETSNSSSGCSSRSSEVRSPDRCEPASATAASVVPRADSHLSSPGRRKTYGTGRRHASVSVHRLLENRDGTTGRQTEKRVGAAAPPGSASASSSVRPSGQRVRRRSVTSRPRETKSAAVSRPPGSSSSSLR